VGLDGLPFGILDHAQELHQLRPRKCSSGGQALPNPRARLEIWVGPVANQELSETPLPMLGCEGEWGTLTAMSA
jgi:hypothetical protein